MKKSVLAILCAIFAVTFSACGSKDNGITQKEYSKFFDAPEVKAIKAENLATARIRGDEFETALFFNQSLPVGEMFAITMFHKNTTGKKLNKKAPYVEVYRTLGDYRIFVGNVYDMPNMVDRDTYNKNQIHRSQWFVESIIHRVQIFHLTTGKQIGEYNPNTGLFDYTDEERTFLVEMGYDLKTPPLGDEPPTEFNRVNAPVGKYTIRLSTGQIIDDAFYIV